MATSQQVNAYIAQVLPAAQRQSARTGIPVSVMLAQSGYETGWGTSQWWRVHLNPAGIGVTGAPGAGQSFASVDAAFAAYADKLLGKGEAGQQQFVRDVNAGAGPQQLLSDLEASPWAAGHYGGTGLNTTWQSLGLAQYDLPGAKPPPGGNPVPGGGSASGAVDVSLHVPGTPYSVPTPGDLFGGLTGTAGDIAGGLTKPLISFAQSVAVRVALVLFGAVALLLGLALLFHDADRGSSSSTSGGSGGGGSSSSSSGGGGAGPAPAAPTRTAPLHVGRSRPVRGEGGAGHDAAADVKQTAEGAAEAV